jgi:hypothetical protein
VDPNEFRPGGPAFAIRRRRERAIVHEAGHWFACELLGIPIRNYQIAQDGGGHVEHDESENPLSGICIALAGTLPKRQAAMPSI